MSAAFVYRETGVGAAWIGQSGLVGDDDGLGSARRVSLDRIRVTWVLMVASLCSQVLRIA